MSSRGPAPVALALAPLLAVVTGVVLAGVDVGVTRSDVAVESVVATSVPDGDALVAVHVPGDAAADAELEAALVDALRARGVDAVALPTPAERHDGPVLVVGHETWTLSYTPVRGDATVSWRHLYVRNGDLSAHGRSTVDADDFSADRLATRLAGPGFESVPVVEGAGVVSEGEFDAVDATSGAFSLPRYDRHVRDVVVATTVEALLAERR